MVSNIDFISPYVIPGLKFENMPSLDQEYKAEMIINKISDFFKVPVNKIKSQSRLREIMTPRHWCMWFIRCNTNLSLKSIGEIMGGRDHTTCINSIQIIKGYLKTPHDNEFKEHYEKLIQII